MITDSYYASKQIVLCTVWIFVYVLNPYMSKYSDNYLSLIREIKILIKNLPNINNETGFHDCNREGGDCTR